MFISTTFDSKLLWVSKLFKSVFERPIIQLCVLCAYMIDSHSIKHVFCLFQAYMCGLVISLLSISDWHEWFVVSVNDGAFLQRNAEPWINRSEVSKLIISIFPVRTAAKMDCSNKISLCILVLASILLLCSTGLLVYVKVCEK